MDTPPLSTAENFRWYSDYVNGPYTRDLRALQLFGCASFVFCLQEMVVGKVESLDSLYRLHFTLLGCLLGFVQYSKTFDCATDTMILGQHYSFFRFTTLGKY